MRHRLVALAVVLGALFGAALLAAAPASAHATVESSDPADGARLPQAPATVTVRFDEAVSLGSLSYLHVVDQQGSRVESGTVFHPGGDAVAIRVELRSGLGDGTYTASFRVISADSHPVAGVIRFVVGNGPLVTGATAGVGGALDAVRAAFDAARWTSYAGFALLAGVWLVLSVWHRGRDDRRARRIIWGGWAALVAGTVLEFLLQGPYVAGEGLGHMLDGSLLDATLHSTYGRAHSVRLVLLGLGALLLGRLFAALTRRESRLAELAWPLGPGVALTFAVTGHADTTDPRWLSVLFDTLHLSAMAAWLGGLVLLVAAVLPRREPAETAAAVSAVSAVSLGAVAVLAGTGTYAAWRGIGSPDAVVGTTYGRLVVLKGVLFAALIALGWLARRSIASRHTERLRRGVLVEVVLGVAVLVATSVLVSQPRGSEALAASYAKPVHGVAPLDHGRSAVVSVDPGRHGLVGVTVEIADAPRAATLAATAALPAKQVGPIPLPLRADGPGRWVATGVTLPASGRWVVTLTVTTSEFDATTTDTSVRLH